MPLVSIRLGAERRSLASPAGDDAYGEIEYRYGGRSDISRSTSPREILPLLYGLAGMRPPAPIPAADYPGYPHVADGEFALVWFWSRCPC
jgi:ABC-2 type transport system permease protein